MQPFLPGSNPVRVIAEITQPLITTPEVPTRKLPLLKSPWERAYEEAHSVKAEREQYFSDMTGAFVDYTFAGPVELMGMKSGGQAVLLTRAGLYSTLSVGLAIEFGMDFAIVGAVLTLFDPGHKWQGGLDESADSLHGKDLTTWDTSQPLMHWRQSNY